MMTTRKTEDGRPVIRLRCKPYALQPLKNWDMFVGHDGTVFVEYHGVDAEGPYTYWDNCHNLSPAMVKRAHNWAGYGR